MSIDGDVAEIIRRHGAERAELHGDERRVLSQSDPGYIPLRAPFADIAAELHLDSAIVAAGDDLPGTATLTNRVQDRLSFVTGLMAGGVRHPGDDKLTGAFTGAVAAVGLNVDLRHGQSKDVPVVIGTSSCLPDRSYVVPAGAYEVVAVLSINCLDDHGRATGRRCFVVIGPTIEVTLDGATAS